MKKYIKSLPNLAIVFCADLCIVCLAYYLAYYVRFDFDVPPAILSRFKETVIAVLIIKIPVFCLFRLYRGMWRFTSITDLFNVLRASTVASGLLVLFFLYLNRFSGLSRSVFIIDWFLTVLLISGFRILVRVYFEGRFQIWVRLVFPMFFCGSKESFWKLKTRLLIIGAGNSGEKILREIRVNAGLEYQVIGFVDDHPVKKGKYIHGKQVLGGIEDLGDIALRSNAEELLIAISSATSKQMRRIVSECKETGLPYKTIPGIGEIISGEVSVNSIREVSYNDLLGRDNIKLDSEIINTMICKSTVLVTGAGGSIGSELCRQICRFNPTSVILFERAESPLYAIDMELKHFFPHLNIVPVLGDIQYLGQLDKVFEEYRPDIVFHAAAYKHVPMMESHAWKAVKNNVIGTQNVVEVSRKYDVKRFVLVSTDKAVRPTNVMGTTKRIGEMMVLNQMHEGDCQTKFMAVRFGNVVGSAGSVLPLFKKQIEEGGPITVTDKEITRFFMTIPEAAQLILQAGAMGEGGKFLFLIWANLLKLICWPVISFVSLALSRMWILKFNI
ncbi:NDP-sugar epimerase, includes UDP-GlcNAc-inverting 4,6-dehydratase FlaA1 and capsular polysaccharide biosynthesis protein EpsC [Desulfoluna spongiiphila]|uniref:NDP-sugar epimerase, includes UDP-GlcNAc-inverting 4,6-dehydratase FlaA1 and capsular polysaccharide biosynthesis protein EpsC n=1 Tax=Desulfoluna spongiiphila TaxID=419481 RepID=A0A1G5JT73_9BACT|nr:NDP-sugar epimerase, includes UDP-GlcNAc-inverting 4,6-dehydratase FlaA1 and capsular polysaccharide biosynthesis protein EpsC [Desulfoluna spongiiphila]